MKEETKSRRTNYTIPNFHNSLQTNFLFTFFFFFRIHVWSEVIVINRFELNKIHSINWQSYKVSDLTLKKSWQKGQNMQNNHLLVVSKNSESIIFFFVGMERNKLISAFAFVGPMKIEKQSQSKTFMFKASKRLTVNATLDQIYLEPAVLDSYPNQTDKIPKNFGKVCFLVD